MDNETIAKKLKKLRGEKSMREVANAVGISASALGMYETGKRIPRDSIKKKLAEYYQYPLVDLFF